MDTCVIDTHVNAKIYKWDITKEALEKLYPLLYQDIENSGEFNLEFSKKKTSHKVTLVKGDKDSVEAPKAIVNYHTHPISCYLGEKTIWGFPSGEDFRESVLFGLKGSVAHITPSIEGVYVSQVNPCILQTLLYLEQKLDFDAIKKNKSLWKLLSKYKYTSENKLTDFFRGLIILCIEVYFRSTHVFRGYDFNIEPSRAITPDDFINFSNIFKLDNIFNKDEIEGCGNLKCNSVWTFDKKNHTKLSFGKYCKDFEEDAKVFMCNAHGDAEYSKIKLNTAIKNGALDIIKNIEFGTKCKYPSKLWNENWFLLSLTPNKVLLKKGLNSDKNMDIEYISPKLSTDDRMTFLTETYKYGKMFPNEVQDKNNGFIFIGNKTPVFYYFDMRGNCDYNNVIKDLRNNKEMGLNQSMNSYQNYGNSYENNRNNDIKKFLLFGSSQCGYCERAVKNIKEKYGENSLEVRYFDTIRGAVNEASKYAGQKFDTIPVVFEYGTKTRIDHSKL